MARWEKIGCFGLTEPFVGSGTSGGLTTTAKRGGDAWILNSHKRWIGNAPLEHKIAPKVVQNGEITLKNVRVRPDRARRPSRPPRRRLRMRPRRRGERQRSCCS
jgi:hypothetical protein